MPIVKRDKQSSLILVAVAVVTFVGAFIYGYTRPPSPVERPDLAVVERGPAGATASETGGESRQHSQPTASSSGEVAAEMQVAERSPSDASGQIGEERFVRIATRIVIAAIGFQNAGQGNEELVTYVEELLKEEGVTQEAFQEATDQITSDPEQAARVRTKIMQRVERRIGTKMDMKVLGVLNPAMAGKTEQGPAANR